MKTYLTVSSLFFMLLALHQLPSASAEHVRGSTPSPKQKGVSDASTTTERGLKKKKKKKSTAKAKGAPKKVSDKERSGVLDLSEVAIGEEDDVTEEIELQFMADEDSIATFTDLERIDDPDSETQSWVGSNEDGETFTYSKSTSPETGEKFVSGSMMNKDGVGYSFWGQEGGTAELLETLEYEHEIEVVAEDRPKVMDGEFGPSDLFWESRRLAETAMDDTSFLDVLIVYTPETERALGTVGNVRTHVDSTIAWSNLALRNSGINTRFRLAGGRAFPVSEYDRSFSESGRSWGAMLNNLRSRTDGVLDFVHALRDQVNGDFVAMLAAQSGACGIGYVNQSPNKGDAAYAFSVTRYTCSTSGLSFVHELGHNMGLNHDRNQKGHTNVNTYPTPNYGFQDPSRRFRTVLAYSCPGGGCPRQPVFSGSNNNWNGMSAGDHFNDNTKYVNTYLPIYADWRISNNAGPPETPRPPTPSPTPPPTPQPTPQPVGGGNPPISNFPVHCDNDDEQRFAILNRRGQIKPKDCTKVMNFVQANRWNRVNTMCGRVDVSEENDRNGKEPFVWQLCQKECSLSNSYADRLYNVNRENCPQPVSG